MTRQTVAIRIGVFVLVVAGMFAYSYYARTQLAEVEEPVQNEDQNVSPYAGIERIDAKHFFIDGEHTLAGEIQMPTPCDLVDTTATVAESFPEQVTIDFNVINTSEMCAQVLTTQRFKVSFSASEEAAIRGRLNGREIELNLVPAAEGESPDDFELFIKG